jgi:hypothetical protein
MSDVTRDELLAWLEARHAWPDMVAWARQQTTARHIVELCRDTDWRVWLIEHVGGAALDEYQQIAIPAYQAYERIQTPAWARYVSFAGPAWEKCRRIQPQEKVWSDPAYHEYRRIDRVAGAEYDLVVEPAWIEYRAMLAQAARAACTWERVAAAVRSTR